MSSCVQAWNNDAQPQSTTTLFRAPPLPFPTEMLVVSPAFHVFSSAATLLDHAVDAPSDLVMAEQEYFLLPVQIEQLAAW